MEKKQASLTMILGIIVNILLLAFLGFMYWNSIPKEGDLNGAITVKKPQVYNSVLEKELSSLKKVSGIPINIDPSELGKQNPYNP